MGGQFRGSIVLSHNPVSLWETYARTFAPDEYSGLRVKNDAEGGNISASFVLFDHSETFLHGFLAEGLGRDVRIGSEDGRVIWEGFVHEMELDYGSIVYRVSLTSMANRVWMRYRIRGSSTTSRSTAQNHTGSQAKFGIKEFILGGGELESSAVADQTVTRYLNEMKWPRATPAQIRLGTSFRYPPTLKVTAKGYIETLRWRTYNQTVSTGAQNASAQISDILTAAGQFVAAQTIVANTTQVTKVYDVDRTAYDIMADIARLGDATFMRWNIAMTPTYGHSRMFFYGPAYAAGERPANLINIFEATPGFRDGSGRKLKPYDVQAGKLTQIFGPSLPGVDAATSFDNRNNVFSEGVEWDEDLSLTMLTNRAERISVLLARVAGKDTI